MKKSLFLAAALLAAAVTQGAELKSALLPKAVKINWHLEELTSKAGEKETYKTDKPANIAVTQTSNTDNRKVDLKITLKNNSKTPRFLRVVAMAEIPFKDYKWWNGYVNDNSGIYFFHGNPP